MVAFRSVFFVAVLTVGCGGRTNDGNPSAASGTNALGGSGAVTGSASGGASGSGSGGAGSVGGSGGGSGSSSGDPCRLTSPCIQVSCPNNCEEIQAECCHTTMTGAFSGAEGTGAPDAGFASSDATPAADAGEAGTPPSCAPGGPGMTNCGPGGSGTESCCTSLEVEGGTYYRTYTSDTDGGATGEADPATVSGFRLDEYEVTVGRFRQFVSAWNGGWTPAAASGKHTHLNEGRGLVAVGPPTDAGVAYEPGWVATDETLVAPTNGNLSCANLGYADMQATWTPAVGHNETLPINCVTWYEAYAFCIWDGGFLPSEAEWEYAAAGGSQQREYPWGSTDPGTSNEYAIYNSYYPSGTITSVRQTNIAAVGTTRLGAGLWGQMDLAGNVDEWSLDARVYFALCTDCYNLQEFQYPDLAAAATTGGDYGDPKPALRAAEPGSSNREDRFFGFGFRCARTP
jgi:formylglycine-generating enzyme required for sulfatase activity